ncbi:alkaline phosphatase family protein [Sphingobacterium shayense]|uniref:alkaline phosphatase family protein n=1 Tax=Sphingobacterium shayense TaxID=626343 RepID=UPI001554DCAF|nr:nucleotide pyrophosphatase/phosphodiesterase family protein [Sphingobacterium shayense]NQD69398.1 alkaline phosphatase family protein [Sphingobacterium shayense]
MQRIAVIDIVGLSTSIIGEHTPIIREFIEKHKLYNIKPVLPAVTTSAQTTYLTGLHPKDHGIVGNGWYDKDDAEIKFWKQSNKLVQGENIWQTAKKMNPAFTCAQMFWWYNMYNDADFSVTPRPNYLADGRKIPDCYAYPASLRDELTEKFGKFPLFNFWGPNANIKSSRWIADAAMYVESKHQPTLNLIYLPHLDYCLQKYGPSSAETQKELSQIDALVGELIAFFSRRNVEIVLLSEYGIAPVNRPVHINRILRKEGLLEIRIERGRELLDAAACQAFAVADHQIAHIYVNDQQVKQRLKTLLTDTAGIAKILDKNELTSYHINHDRAGDLVLLAEPDSWFTYYFWEDDAVAPDYARMVDIHKKPGYDPVEMFMSSKSRAIFKLLLKKIGLRAILDITPLDASLVKGSHGITDIAPAYHPVFIGDIGIDGDTINATDVKQLLLDKIFANQEANKLSLA